MLRFFVKEDDVYEAKYDKTFINSTQSIAKKISRKISKIAPMSARGQLISPRIKKIDVLTPVAEKSPTCDELTPLEPMTSK